MDPTYGATRSAARAIPVRSKANAKRPMIWFLPSGPGAFTGDMWAMLPQSNGTDVRILLLSVPAGPLTAIEYQVDGGPWTFGSAADASDFLITGYTTGVTINVAIRAVSSGGPGPASIPKPVMPEVIDL